MKRQECIDKITTYAARFVAEVKGFNAGGHYHVNIHSENFLIPVLNNVYNLKLENVNHTERKNYPAIDLVDLTNRVAFQITSSSDLAKIKSTLETFFEHKLEEKIDTLYFYMLTDKQGTYSDARLKSIIADGFNFSSKLHIIDSNDLLEKINAISATPVLVQLTKLFQQEFSDIQIEQRKKKYDNGAFNCEAEDLYTNFIEIEIPAKLYKAELSINEDVITERMNEYRLSKGLKTYKKYKIGKLIKNELRHYGVFHSDWILHEKSIYTFRNLHNSNENISTIIDKGTITEIDCKSFYNNNEDHSRVFKHLLRQTLTEFCRLKDIEWFGNSEVFRFANNQVVPNKKQVQWKGKKKATKTVIFEIMNKAKEHIICFRSLAFRAEFDTFDDKWFLILNPTWSYTNPGGYKTSRFESSYMSGIKRMENNSSICNYFRFFSSYLSSSDLFSAVYPYLKAIPAQTVSLSPRLEEKAWKAVKATVSETSDTDTVIDNELTPTIFD